MVVIIMPLKLSGPRKVVLVGNVKDVPYKCHFCHKVFITEAHRTRHAERRHSERTNDFKSENEVVYPPANSNCDVIQTEEEILPDPEILPRVDPPGGPEISVEETINEATSIDSGDSSFSSTSCSSDSFHSESIREGWLQQLNDVLKKTGVDPSSQGITDETLKVIFNERIQQESKMSRDWLEIRKKLSQSVNSRIEAQAKSTS